jgi:hypothetical protein
VRLLTEVVGVKRGLKSAETRSEMAMVVAGVACRGWGSSCGLRRYPGVYGTAASSLAFPCKRTRAREIRSACDDISVQARAERKENGRRRPSPLPMIYPRARLTGEGFALSAQWRGVAGEWGEEERANERGREFQRGAGGFYSDGGTGLWCTVEDRHWSSWAVVRGGTVS